MVAQRWLSGRIESMKKALIEGGFELDELFPQCWVGVGATSVRPYMSG